MGMRRPHAWIVLLAALVLAPAAMAGAQDQDAVPGQIVVRFTAAADPGDRAQARDAADVTVRQSLDLPRTQLVQVEPGQTVDEAIATLNADGDVRSAEPNWIFHATSTTPDDPSFTNLWAFNNTGQAILGTSGTADADINAPEAWDLATGGSSGVVAVVDTGVAYDHPDLAANMVPGHDFVDGDNDPRDLNGHGTHVAGTIAAAGDNGVGVAGVSWSARIMPVRVLDASGSGTYADVVSGFNYAGDHGARVVNASLGGAADASSVSALQAAVDNHPNTLYVVAAGNDGADVDGPGNADYPCDLTSANLICVAATTSKDQLASFSNYGTTSVDLGAPGTSIYSTLPATAELPDTAATDGFESGLSKWIQGGSGGSFNATSSPTTPWSTAHGIAVTPEEGSQVLDDAPTAADYKSGENYWIQTASKVDLTGRVGCALSYALGLDVGGTDHLYVETSPDGSTWTQVDDLTGYYGRWYGASTALLADGQKVYVRFRLQADTTTTGNPPPYDGIQIDDVRVKCVSTTYSSSDYGYLSGTSMASPMVAGAATLLVSADPSATVAELRSWLLSSGDAISALSGKTVSGRRLNLYNALTAAGITSTSPILSTDAPSGVGQSAATLNGSVNPNGTSTQYAFQWGTSTAYGNSTPATPADAGSGSAAVSVSQTLSGLSAGTTYHYRLVAYRSGVVSRRGADQTFTTQSPPVTNTSTGSGPSGPAASAPPATATTPVSPPAAPAQGTPAASPPAEEAPAAQPASNVPRPTASLPAKQPLGGVRLSVGCAARCAFSGRLTISARSAVALGLSTRTVGAKDATLRAGSRALDLGLTKRVLRAARRRHSRRLRATLTYTLSVPGAAPLRVTRNVTIRVP